MKKILILLITFSFSFLLLSGCFEDDMECNVIDSDPTCSNLQIKICGDSSGDGYFEVNGQKFSWSTSSQYITAVQDFEDYCDSL
ncbi:MAG: hypothetical protein CVV44_17435 [Spirochaetae bacterium HGW-Spirochaetae-1]|jgi:hypothetical protein|nr:MAG: hypothetical protein CVV44_17435 [Spirochaetae bacterium HGW-Spirochaetae-1]